MAAKSNKAIPPMMILFVVTLLDMEARVLLALAILSSAPCKVSLACVIVSRCLCRSCRMLTPSSWYEETENQPSESGSTTINIKSKICIFEFVSHLYPRHPRMVLFSSSKGKQTFTRRSLQMHLIKWL